MTAIPLAFELPERVGHEILRCEVGSTLHGTGLPGGEDHDEMGLALEAPVTTIGLRQIEHYTKRSKPEGIRSEPGDTDLTVYTARKWARLAMKGNPSVLLVLFAPADKVLITTPEGDYLRAHAHWFASKRAGSAFLGYMEHQRSRLTGDRGAAGRIRSRGECTTCSGSGVDFSADNGIGDHDGTEKPPKCSECGGSGRLPDWKYAMHLVRLGHQGVEFLIGGEMTLPVPGALGDHLRSIRRGEITMPTILAEAETLEAQIKRLLDGDSALPDEPDVASIEDWLVRAHLRWWYDAGLA